jgi:hypothetical protein
VRNEVNAVIIIQVTHLFFNYNVLKEGDGEESRFGENTVLDLVQASEHLNQKKNRSYPEGYATPSKVPCQGDARICCKQACKQNPPRKIDVTSKLPVESIPVVTLIRTDTTLDHSQKAEKV